MPYKIILLTLLLFTASHSSLKACSMYKITQDNQTWVGCNEDAWRTTPPIWFEPATDAYRYGAVFTGSRQIGNEKYAPQSGMNDQGLVFSRLGSYHPERKSDTSKKSIPHMETLLTHILHQCASVTEVKQQLEPYDFSPFIDDIFIYVDTSGDYLIVEPYSLYLGDDPSYVLSNFCPTITDNDTKRQLHRYRNGEDYLSIHPVTPSLDYCTAVSDTMHVHRERNGDGTLLTSIWDTQQKKVHLYFYHDFETVITLDIQKELDKGEQLLAIDQLFPANKNFERLGQYITPFNTPWIRILLVVVAGFLGLLSLAQLIWAKSISVSGKTMLVLFNVLMIGYLFVLATNINIYYFDAPYVTPSNVWVTYSSYLPFLLLGGILVLGGRLYLLFRSEKSTSAKTILLGHQVIYLLLFAGFMYWGLYAV